MENMIEQEYKRGYFLIAIGTEYVNEAINLVKTLRKVNDNFPVAILCTDNEKQYASESKMFDRIVLYNFDNKFAKNDYTQFEKYGGTPKILIPEYTPFEKTMYLDTDVLVQSNPESVWQLFENTDCAVSMMGVNDYSCITNNIANRLGIEVNDVHSLHSGVVYFDKSHKDFNTFVDTLHNVWRNDVYSYYGLSCSEFRDGKADEHAFMATFAIMKYKGISGITNPIMTHNYHSTIELPSKIVTGGSMYTVLSVLETPPPFIHMFKQYKTHYNILLSRLLQ
jgi:hypothetical protein